MHGMQENMERIKKICSRAKEKSRKLSKEPFLSFPLKPDPSIRKRDQTQTEEFDRLRERVQDIKRYGIFPILGTFNSWEFWSASTQKKYKDLVSQYQDFEAETKKDQIIMMENHRKRRAKTKPSEKRSREMFDMFKSRVLPLQLSPSKRKGKEKFFQLPFMKGMSYSKPKKSEGSSLPSISEHPSVKKYFFAPKLENSGFSQNSTKIFTRSKVSRSLEKTSSFAQKRNRGEVEEFRRKLKGLIEKIDERENLSSSSS